MGYPKELDEYTDAELHKEIQRRWQCKRDGLCYYCKQPIISHTCKFAANMDIEAGRVKKAETLDKLVEHLRKPW